MQSAMNFHLFVEHTCMITFKIIFWHSAQKYCFILIKDHQKEVVSHFVFFFNGAVNQSGMFISVMMHCGKTPADENLPVS